MESHVTDGQEGTCSFPDTTNSFNSTAYTTSNVNDVPPLVINIGNSIIDAAETVNYWRFIKTLQRENNI